MRYVMIALAAFTLSAKQLDDVAAGKAILTTSKVDVPGSIAGKNVPNVVKGPGGNVIKSPVGAIYLSTKKGK